MQPIERILDVLPLPVLAAIAVVVLVAWILKQVRTKKDYGPVLREPLFIATLAICCVVLVIFYGFEFAVHRTPPFGDTERGIVVASFINDNTNTVREQTVRSLEDSLYSKSMNVKIRPVDQIIKDQSDALPIVSKMHAMGAVWGSFTPPNVVHYRISWRGQYQEARLSIQEFPKVTTFDDEFLKELQLPQYPKAAKSKRLKTYKTRLQSSPVKTLACERHFG